MEGMRCAPRPSICSTSARRALRSRFQLASSSASCPAIRFCLIRANRAGSGTGSGPQKESTAGWSDSGLCEDAAEGGQLGVGVGVCRCCCCEVFKGDDACNVRSRAVAVVRWAGFPTACASRPRRWSRKWLEEAVRLARRGEVSIAGEVEAMSASASRLGPGRGEASSRGCADEEGTILPCTV